MSALSSVVTGRQSLLASEWKRQPTATDAECVEAIASRLLREWGIDEAPVDVELVASALGIVEVRCEPALLESGCLVLEAGRLVVCLRASDAPVRRRFTLCHEGVHTFFPGFERTVRFRCSPTTTPRRRGSRSLEGAAPAGSELEALCDIGASALLLPRHLFGEDSRSLPPQMDSIEQLADRYEASLEATARRFAADRGQGEAFVVLKVQNKPRDPAGAVAQLRVAASTSAALTGWIPQHKSVRSNGPFGRALEGEIVNETALVSDVITPPRRLRISARAYSYTDADGRQVQRVLALLSTPAP